MLMVTGGVLAVPDGASTGIGIDPFYADEYTFDDLGGVPGAFFVQGMTFKYDDPNTLLFADNGVVKAIEVERGCNGQITGFVGSAVEFASAPGIDGGLAYGPGNVLFYTTFNDNNLGQIMPGSTEPDRIIDLTQHGVSPPTGTLQFVPEGFPAAGRLKILSYSASTWYDAAVEPDGNGTYDLVDVTEVANVGGGPEGLAFVGAGSPQFDTNSAIDSKFNSNVIDTYEVDVNGDPILATQRNLVFGASSAYGAAINPETGDFVFTYFSSSSRVIVVRGFESSCSADFDGSGAVEVNDLLALLSSWGDECSSADLNSDGVVDVTDLLSLLSQWGACE